MEPWEVGLASLGIIAVLWALAVAGLVLAGRRGDATALARFVPDCVVLVKRLLGDPRVSGWRKVVLLPVVAYLASPIDLVPDFIPVAGQLDDVIVLGLGLRVVLGGADADVLRSNWPGPAESLAVVERFAFSGSRSDALGTPPR